MYTCIYIIYIYTYIYIYVYIYHVYIYNIMKQYQTFMPISADGRAQFASPWPQTALPAPAVALPRRSRGT